MMEINKKIINNYFNRQKKNAASTGPCRSGSFLNVDSNIIYGLQIYNKNSISRARNLKLCPKIENKFQNDEPADDSF